MKAMTSSAAIRTRDATGTPPPVTRRRTVSPSRPVRPNTPTRIPRTSATRNGAVSGQAARSGTAAFALLVVGLLGGALVGLLLLNTTLAQQSFERSELQQENQRLEERRQALQEDIARESSPEVLHDKARRLGMRDTGDQALTDPRAGR
jgi:cell division protein FtsB